MGQALSQESITLYQTADAYGGEGQDVFEVGFDELPLETAFQTDLFSKPKDATENKLVLPSPELLSDILKDYLTFSSTSSVEESFTKVVIPLFNSTLDTKPRGVQIITNLFRFLRDRCLPFFVNEENRLRTLQEKINGIQADITNAHRRIPPPKFDSKKICENDDSILSFFNELDTKIKFEAISPHQSYGAITAVLSLYSDNEEGVYKLLKWGFAAAEISAIIKSFVTLTEFSISEDEKTNDFTFKLIEPTIASISLANTCFSPPTSSLISSTVLTNFSEIGSYQTSFIATDGTSLYVLGKEKKLTIVSLSKNITKHENRFKQFTLNELTEEPNSDMVMTYSNGFLVIASRKNPMFSIYTTNPFKRIEQETMFSINGIFSLIPKCEPPFATDSKYFYALNAPAGVAVFSVNDSTIIFHRFISFKPSSAKLAEPYSSEFFPQDFLSGLIATTNGVTISFIKKMRNNDESNVYFARHFSLVDGHHICDSQFSLDHNISTITYDPWNRCYWGIASSDKPRIINIPAFNSQAPWLTGCDINHVSRFDVNAPCNTHGEVSLGLLNFLEYYTIHFAGLSFNAAQSNQNYSPQIARFFAPCTNEAVKSIADAIEFFMDLYEKGCSSNEWTTDRVKKALLSLIRLLDYNLSNMYLTISANDGEEPKKFEHQIMINKLLYSIISNEKLSFLHEPIVFTIVNSLELLFTDNLQMLPSVFDKIVKKMDKQFILYTLQKVHNMQLYPYCFSSETIPLLFKPIIENYPDIKPAQFELIETYMRSLFIGVRTALLKKKNIETTDSLIQSFDIFCNLMFENFILRLDNIPRVYTSENKIPQSSLFEKFFMMLHSLQQFPTIVENSIDKLRDLFLKFTEIIKSMKFEAPISPHHNIIFYSLFSCYIDFIDGLMKNTFQLKGSLQYSWLYKPTRESDLTPHAVDEFLKSSFENNTRRQMLRKGLSFNIHAVALTSQMQEDFLRALVAEKENIAIQSLLDYLYSKISDQMKKMLTPEVRHVERFLLGAFAKQLGFTADLCQLSTQIIAKKTPEIPTFIRQTVQSVYKIRRVLKLSKQATIQYQNKFAEGQEIKPSPKIEENYNDYITTIMKKCVYLIHIQPCLRQMENQESAFPLMLKKLSNFIISDITLELYFEEITSAKKAQDMISKGIRYITEIVTNDFSSIYSLFISYILEKFSTSDGVMTLVQSGISVMNDGSIPEEINDTIKLMDIVVDLSVNLQGECSRNTFITFFTNTAFGIGKLYPQLIVEPTIKIIKMLISNNSYFSKKNSQSIISMLVSMFWVLSQISPEFAKSKTYKELYETMTSACELDVEDPLTIQLFYRSGMDAEIHPQVIVNYIMSCSPKKYSRYISVLAEICISLNERIPIFYWILHEISSICSGGHSSFMYEQFAISETSLLDEKLCKTPDVVLSGCLNLIQLVRRFLNDSASPSGRMMMNIFVYILNCAANKNPDESNKDLEIFNDPLLYYGVFGVLSNVIDVISFSSLIKVQATSTLYYVSGISQEKSEYYCWSLPITGDSSIKVIPFSENIISVTPTPFSPSTFPIYDSLVPVFLRFLALKNPSPFYEALSYYVFSSMKEYCTELTFFNKLVDEQIYNILPEFQFDNYNNDFLSIVRSHLANNTNGFNEPKNNAMKFHYASPGILNETSGLVFSDTHFEVTDGLHVFMTPIFNPDQDVTLSIEENGAQQNFDVGFYHLSISESNIKTLIFSKRGKKASISGKVRKSLSSDENPKKRFKLIFDSKTTMCTIYNTSKDKPLMTHTFPSNMVCFVLVLYPGTNIDYSLTSSAEQDKINQQGRILFTRNRKKNVKLNLSDMKPSVSSSSDITALNVKSHPYRPLIDFECERFSSPGIKQPFALYPDVIKPKEPNIETEKCPKIPTQPVKYQPYDVQATEMIHFSPPPFSYFVAKEQSDTLITTVLNPKDTVVIDPFTGSIKRKDRRDDFVTSETLPLIHPRNFSTLPSEILNHFATGYAHKLRKTLLSTILLQCYSPSSIGIEEALVKFNFTDVEALLKSLLSLLTTIEPFDLVALTSGKIPINFNLDLLDPNVLQPNSSHFLQKSAITNIIDYLHKSDKMTNFIEHWFKSLIREMSDTTSHSVKQNHPYAVLIEPSSLTTAQTITKVGATQWIVVKTGFSSSDDESIKIAFKGAKDIKLTSKILVIPGSTFIISATPQDKPLNKIAAIPVMKDETNTMSGTFLDLIISFKYFVSTLAKEKKSISFTQMQKYRARIYCAFIDSFIGNSPFFVTFGNETVRFLQHHIPILSSDFVGGLLTRINYLATYTNKKKYPYIASYLEEIQALWDERIFFNLKHYFEFFASESDLIELKLHKKEPFKLPSTSQFPDTFDQSTPKQKLFVMLKRIFIHRENQYGYPFPQLLVYWAKYSIQCPPTQIQRINSKLLKAEFIEYVPKTVRLQIIQATNITMKYSFSQDMSEAKEFNTMNNIELNGKNTLFIQITDETNVWELLNVYFISKNTEKPEDFIMEHRDWFVSDISQILFKWDNNTDRTILSTFSYSQFVPKKLQVKIEPQQLAISSLTQPLNILCLRAHFLLILNWFYGCTMKEKFMQDSSVKQLLPLISKKLKLTAFRDLVRSKAQSRRPTVSIDRKSAIEVREGVSSNLNMTIAAQMVDVYTNPSIFRDDSDKPWEVSFKNEQGIDAGGPARELVTELALDVCSVNCGLVVPTPNARNEVGQYRDCVIPLPNPSISNPDKRYRIFGAAIAISIRTGLVQTFNLPPLFWEFLITGELTIELIYEIDENYKVLIDSFKEAQRSGMDDEAFRTRLNHKFVITDSRGNEMPLKQRGRQESVTASNCAQFISLANEFRLNELKPWLTKIRDGMWENIGLSPIASLDWPTLEFAACGEREITFEALRKVTSFEGVDKKQEDIFIKVIETLTSEQRSLLLRFATGRIRLPPNSEGDESFLKIDSTGGIDIMPTASTCFHQMHLPTYTSFEKALKLITLAIEYTGTMELH